MTLFVEQQTEITRAVSRINICQDPDDNSILAAAVDSKCTYLVTGDVDLLVLKAFQGVTLVNPREFMESVPAE